jgi:maltose/maltodextrin transport system permease protein
MSATAAITAATAATTAVNAAVVAVTSGGGSGGGPRPSRPRKTSSGPLGFALAALFMLGVLWLTFGLYRAGQPIIALAVLVFGALVVTVYATSVSLAWRYLFPGVAGMLLFVAFPLLYTVQIGFTNYSSSNLLEFERARDYLLAQTSVDEAQAHDFSVHAAGNGRHELRLVQRESGKRYATAALDLSAAAQAGQPLPLAAQAESGTAAPGEPLPLREVIALRSSLQVLTLQAPGGPALQYSGLREFAPLQPLWKAQPDGSLLQVASGKVYAPNDSTGFFETAQGERVSPGFRVGIGWANYSRMLFDADFRGPFVAIFIWTVAFAGLTVLFAGSLGMALAVLLNWEVLRGRTLYRTLLFLPYAVPGFISILVFKGLFNQNFGEINAILHALFGIRPAWFADPWLAKGMLLIVNTWLGFPYFMILCTGLIKAIPADLYEASALAGAKPLDNFFKITAPLIIKPLTPLLIAAFAFNFNNFVLIALLTDGRPDFLNTKLPAGTTDILVSYTYRIAFTDAGQNFGLAAAISTIIFVLVAAMALLQLRATQKAALK